MNGDLKNGGPLRFIDCRVAHNNIGGEGGVE